MENLMMDAPDYDDWPTESENVSHHGFEMEISPLVRNDNWVQPFTINTCVDEDTYVDK